MCVCLCMCGKRVGGSELINPVFNLPVHLARQLIDIQNTNVDAAFIGL